MTELNIREYRSEDLPELSGLWQRCFGDNEEFIAAFFDALGDMGSGVAALIGDKIVGAAYTLNGQELIDGSGKKPVLGYIYGVAVDEEYRGRGIGAELCRAVYALSKKREARIVCTLPAEESLGPWYEKTLGLKPRLWRQKRSIAAREIELSMPLSSTEYMIWRENMLRGKRHVHLSNHALEFEKKLLAAYGGGFLAVESGIAAAYLDGETAIIRELICPVEATERAAASVAAALGAKTALLFSPAKEDGELYIMADKELPEDCIWNLSFD